ncbi:hypothetical protein RM844_23115 [Streptomyces sp. DSM 44915]|uniref:Uncharacterized protein n=1 Tax=Streptomyces chisholmiae TaxID=3075540 RepID=A0ABU2JWF2_9ACTN|nr:hypothetical protein [Streptomyces sp. DSM 44915]MDT0269182.1 hypothetical protein [Streptomyces sp. DSM 44915]
MSHNQPGPYGQQPPPGQQPGQPGPYGAPPQGTPPGGPNPYAQGGAPGAPGGPGYGYPQAPGAPGQPGQVPGQPGPYGQPQQPGPYGQPQAPGPYGQPPQPPGGYPGQPGQPGQPPYGPPQPAGGGGGNKKLLLGIGGAVVIAAAAVGAYFLISGDDGSGPGSDPDTRYALEFPETFGDYSLAEPPSTTEEFSEEELAQAGLADAEGSSAVYLGGVPAGEVSGPEDLPALGTDATIMLTVGMWGQIDSPEATVDAVLTFGTQELAGDELTLVGEPQSMSPDGLDGAVMKCQEADTESMYTGGTVRVPLCIWADYSTAGFTVFQPLAAGSDGMSMEPREMSLDEAAAHSAQLRTAALVEAAAQTGGEGTTEGSTEGTTDGVDGVPVP